MGSVYVEEFFVPVTSPWFYTEMSETLLAWTFGKHRLHFWPVKYQSTPVNMDEVAETSDMARGRQVVYSYTTHHVLAMPSLVGSPKPDNNFQNRFSVLEAVKTGFPVLVRFWHFFLYKGVITRT